MSKERLYLFDTTLRDGAQTRGVDFSVEDKRNIALALDRLGVDYVEGGWPGANPTDSAFFAAPPALSRARFTAFGMTRRPGRSADNDPGLAGLTGTTAPAICIVGKTWDFQVDVALEIPRSENIDIIGDSIAHLRAKGREAMLDAEHFFDGYKANPAYALDCLKAAHGAGADWVVLCDTNGGTLPHEVSRIVATVADAIPGIRLGIHAHNDTDNAVANSLAAVLAGARQVQGTLNGLGERCGNANLVSLIGTFCLKSDFADRFETGITEKALSHLTQTSRLLDEILNRSPNKHAPYVGQAAFAHKGGLHVSAVLKNPRTYEHVPPEAVGNERQVLISDQAGKSNILARLRDVDIELDPKDSRIDRLLEEVKEREFLGYSYDGADASFELMARRVLGQVPDYFFVDSFKVLVERRYNARRELVTVSEAIVRVQVDGQKMLSVGEGNGPVNALDAALRQDLGKYQSYIDDLELVDFKVRILQLGNGVAQGDGPISVDRWQAGTGAVTRVLIESADKTGNRWSTVGVSANIVEASFQALADAIVFKLYRDGAPAGTGPAE
ncbi:citramalate synthase [Zavarzinia sp.]|uniref:citramalate synthase n=1 Tax=Zavarzinia sp. TaxID=2027920 RepID=UPI003BB706BB